MTPTTPPTDWYDPIVLPGILTLFGVLICVMGFNAEKGGKAAIWKWIGVFLLAVGMFFGFPYFNVMIGHSAQDVIYRSSLSTIRRVSYMHYLAFILPLLAFIVCLAMQFVKKPSAPPPESV